VKQPKLKGLLNKGGMMVPLANFIQATGMFEGEGEQRQEQREERWARRRQGPTHISPMSQGQNSKPYKT
jgi:hypothetical protein